LHAPDQSAFGKSPEIQYLRTAISEEQRQEFGSLVETTINQIEAGHFNSHSGIRFSAETAA
jgi:hypothetical protein